MRPLEYTSEELCVEPRLRIALVTETWPPEINGVAMTLRRMVDGLLERGHRVQLIRPRQDGDVGQQRDCLLDEVLSPGVSLPRYDGLRLGLPAKARLIREWSRQGPDLVHVATEGPLGWTAVSAATRLGVPVTSDFHTNFDHYSGHYGIGWLRQPVSAYLRRFHNRTAMTFVPTHEMARRLRTQGYRNVAVVARGVDTALFNPERRDSALRRSWGLDDDAPAVLCVGRLAAEKNLDLALRAFAAIRAHRADARLVLVGDGPLRAALERAHPDTVFAGMRRDEDLAAHYASADLFLFPSQSETFGNVTLEAMASGLPVVAYDYAAAAEVIRSGDNGLTVPDGDAEAFVRAARRVADDAGLRRVLGCSARQTAETLSWDAVNDRFAEALLQTWIERSPPALRMYRSQPEART